MTPNIVYQTYSAESSYCSDAIDYVEKDETSSMKDGYLSEDTGSKEQKLIQKAKKDDTLTRHIIISPDQRRHIKRTNFELKVSKTMNRYMEDNSMTDSDYVFSLHEKQGNGKHAHILMVGDQSEISMNRGDLEEFKRDYLSNEFSLEFDIEKTEEAELDKDIQSQGDKQETENDGSLLTDIDVEESGDGAEDTKNESIFDEVNDGVQDMDRLEDLIGTSEGNKESKNNRDSEEDSYLENEGLGFGEVNDMDEDESSGDMEKDDEERENKRSSGLTMG